MGLSTIWAPDPRLREKADGENWESLITRIGTVIDGLDAQYSTKNRILVYHGQAMQGMRAYREDFLGDQFRRTFEEPYKYFNNCQLIIYTDENPQDKELTQGRLWVKSVCPWAKGRFGHDWLPVKKSQGL